MERLIARIKEILEKGEKLEVEESVVPPRMEVRLREKSVFFSGGSSGGSENAIFSGKDFPEAYMLLSQAVVEGNPLFERNITEPDLSYLKNYCTDLLKSLDE